MVLPTGQFFLTFSVCVKMPALKAKDIGKAAALGQERCTGVSTRTRTLMFDLCLRRGRE